MIVVDLHQFARPLRLVYAFMAGLSYRSGLSARLYVDKLETVLIDERGTGMGET